VAFKSNLKDHYGDTVIKQCLGKIAKINEFSAFDECCEWSGRPDVCSKVEGRQ